MTAQITSWLPPTPTTSSSCNASTIFAAVTKVNSNDVGVVSAENWRSCRLRKSYPTGRRSHHRTTWSCRKLSGKKNASNVTNAKCRTIALATRRMRRRQPQRRLAWHTWRRSIAIWRLRRPSASRHQTKWFGEGLWRHQWMSRWGTEVRLAKLGTFACGAGVTRHGQSLITNWPLVHTLPYLCHFEVPKCFPLEIRHCFFTFPSVLRHGNVFGNFKMVHTNFRDNALLNLKWQRKSLMRYLPMS